jgi:hypothetical protein
MPASGHRSSLNYNFIASQWNYSLLVMPTSGHAPSLNRNFLRNGNACKRSCSSLNRSLIASQWNCSFSVMPASSLAPHLITTLLLRNGIIPSWQCLQAVIARTA